MLIFLVKLSFLSVDDVIKPMTSSISVQRVPYSNFLELTYQTQAWQNGFSNSSLLQLLPQSCQVPSLKELNLVHILVSPPGPHGPSTVHTPSTDRPNTVHTPSKLKTNFQPTLHLSLVLSIQFFLIGDGPTDG